ncbi:unnamed protein product [Ilex paraguariensis]|uniref:Fe2OG dioxygenase domain-containing protein n=1 Tax=Ilex paraguariensis TaxID=185542 RepID=A0ABC8SBI1_9AQUA
MATTINTNTDHHYDRLEEIKQFDESKIGVKGLVDTGLTAIPRFFHHPPENLPTPKPKTQKSKLSIPIIDLSGHRSAVVDQIRHSSSTHGFFQIINHGIPKKVLDQMLSSIKAFFELPETTRIHYYTREASHGVAYSTNFDLYKSKAASWRDTLQVRLGPTPPEWDYVPELCREAVEEWDREVIKLGEELMGLLSEGLGMERDRLKDMSCLDARTMAAHYYPYCPQADLTVGLTSHTDPGVLTVVLQNEVAGLQVKFGEDWIDVDPVPGGLIINIGDILQIMANDEYKSVEHRVLANPSHEPRVSIAVFFNPSMRDKLYGPLPGLVSPEKPAMYQQFMFSDFMTRFFTKELDGKTLTNYYRVSSKEESELDKQETNESSV